MPKIPIIKAKDFRKYLIKYGCEDVSTKGSHFKIYNPTTNKTSMVAIHGGDDVDRGSFSGVLNQLGIDVDEFIKFIKNN